MFSRKSSPSEPGSGGGGTIHENITITSRSNSNIDDNSNDTRDVFEYYDIVKTIGEGSTCKIYAVRKIKYDNSNNSEDNSNEGNGAEGTTLYALKEISKIQVDDSGTDVNVLIKEMQNEIAIMRTLDHPNIVKVYDVFESKRAIYLIMEYLNGGDLYTRLPYTEEQAAKIMTKLLSAITYLHKKKVVHRDLKLENVMFENDNPQAEIKVIDFGLSKKYIQPTKKYKMHCRVGTAYTMSPQVIKGEYNDKADVWAAGVITYILLSGKVPFDGKTNKEIIHNILKQDYDKNMQGPEWKTIGNKAKAFVKSLLEYDPNRRKSASDALRSAWLQKTFKLEDRRPQSEIMNSVTNALINSNQDGKFKKLAMQVIAHISTTPQLEELRQVFDQLDANNSGTINYYELKKGLKTCKYSNSDIQKIFESVDVNGTGEINYTEFIAATLESRGEIEEERILEAFDKLDLNNTGYISKDELCSVLGKKCTAENCNQVVDELMKEVDTSKDGKISYDEFLVLFRDKHRASLGGATCCPKPSQTKTEPASSGKTGCGTSCG